MDSRDCPCFTMACISPEAIIYLTGLLGLGSIPLIPIAASIFIGALITGISSHGYRCGGYHAEHSRYHKRDHLTYIYRQGQQLF